MVKINNKIIDFVKSKNCKFLIDKEFQMILDAIKGNDKIKLIARKLDDCQCNLCGAINDDEPLDDSNKKEYMKIKLLTTLGVTQSRTYVYADNESSTEKEKISTWLTNMEQLIIRANVILPPKYKDEFPTAGGGGTSFLPKRTFTWDVLLNRNISLEDIAESQGITRNQLDELVEKF